MVPGRFLEPALQVIGHELHIIQIPHRFLHIRLGRKIGVPSGRDGKHIPVSGFVKTFPDSLQQQRKILFIPRIRGNPRQGAARIFPVNINAVQSVFLYQLCRTLRHFFPVLCSPGALGKSVGSPAAYGKQYFYSGIYPADLRQCFLCSASIPYHPGILHLSERDIHDIQTADVRIPHSSQIPGSHISDYFIH